MAASKNITTENDGSVSAWVKKIPDASRRKDILALISLFQSVSGFEAKMWGTAIVGFGSYHYVYESGREGDAPLAGLASRSGAMVFYLRLAPEDREKLLGKLGKHKTGKGCICIKSLADIDQKVLSRMITLSVKHKRTIG